MSKGKYYPKAPKGQKVSPQGMMKQLQQAQKQMEEVQESLASETIEHSAGGGMVTVVVDGHQNVKSIKIDPQVIDPDDPGMLEDLVMVAVSGALEDSKQLAEEKMGGITGGLGLDGLGIPGV